MKDKYLISTLCAFTPILYINSGHVYSTGNIDINQEKKLMVEVIELENNQYINTYNTVPNLILNKANIEKKFFIPISKLDKKVALHLSILSKILYIKKTLYTYKKNSNTYLFNNYVQLLDYLKYSKDIRDYQDNFSSIKLQNFLYDVNKLAAQYGKFIFEYKKRIFYLILTLINNDSTSSILTNKINTALLDKNLFLKLYYKYIKNTNYFINIGDLFDV